jgi:hypothetical protein
MSFSHNQELTVFITDKTHNKNDITHINFKIRSLNAFVDILKDQYATIKDTLEKLLRWSMNPFSLEQPSYQEDVDSYHFKNPHSHHLHHDPCLPNVEVNKFDGWDAMGRVTQLEHYLSLHGITNELVKPCYNVLYLDLQHSKSWKWHKNSYQGYVSWT